MLDQFDRPDINALISEVKERVFPIGRLDYDTEGILILTNDGEFANAVAHPKKSIDKVYIAKIKGTFSEEIADKLFISKRTVDKHRANILEKTGCKNTANLVVYAIKNRLVEI